VGFVRPNPTLLVETGSLGELKVGSASLHFRYSILDLSAIHGSYRSPKVPA
jgi:hypothetical protein